MCSFYVTLTSDMLYLLQLKIFEQKLTSVLKPAKIMTCNKILFIANLILLTNTLSPDLVQYHLNRSLLPVAFVVGTLVLQKGNSTCNTIEVWRYHIDVYMENQVCN